MQARLNARGGSFEDYFTKSVLLGGRDVTESGISPARLTPGAALELVVSMEKTFGVGVPNSEVAAKALRTVNTINDYIIEKRAAA